MRTLFALLLAGPALAADVKTTIDAEPKTLPLSGSVRVVLAAEGPAPLRVELPPPFVDDATALGWRVRPDGPPTTTDVPGGRQRWTAAFRADPWVPGNALTVRFRDGTAWVENREQPVAWPAATVRVSTSAPDEPRPLTGIEEPPAVPTAPDRGWAAWAAVAGLVGVAAGFVAARLLRRPVPPPTPEAWVGERFAEVEQVSDAEFAERLTAAVRGFVQRTAHLPADRFTTAELLAAVAGGPWPANAVVDLKSVLEAADLARFARRPVERGVLLETARRFVASVPPS